MDELKQNLSVLMDTYYKAGYTDAVLTILKDKELGLSKVEQKRLFDKYVESN